MELITLPQLQAKFNSIAEKSINKKYVIDTEINSVINFVNTFPIFRMWEIPKKENKKTKTIFELDIPMGLNELFNNAFNGFITREDFAIERFHFDTNDMYKIKEETVKQAFEFSEYYKWLQELQNNPQKSEKKNILTLNQKVLALDYLGVEISSIDKTKMAKILSAVLGMNEQNIRECLTYINIRKNDVRTKSNLKPIQQLFESQELNIINEKIKKDIETLTH